MRLRLLGIALLVVAAGVLVGPAAHAFVPPAGTSRSAIICNGGYKPGTPCIVAPPQTSPCPSDPGCLEVGGTEVPFLHDGGLLAAQFPRAVPGHPVQLEFYNEGCKTSVPQTIWAAEGTQFESSFRVTSVHSLGAIPRTPPGQSRALSFTLPTNLLLMYVSIDAPAASSACSYPPVQGVWLTIGKDSCSVHAGRQAQAAQACCPTPTLTATARVSRDSREVIATLKAHGLGPRARCGRAELSADHQRIGTVRQTGSTATATARLTGSRSCISRLAATVTQSGASASHDAAVIGGSPTFRLARATRTSSGAIQLLVQVGGLRPADVCGRPEITATVAHASRAVVPLTLLPGSAAAVTAHATLSGREECGTLLQIRVKQHQIDDQIPAPPVSGTAPSSCQMNPSH